MWPRDQMRPASRSNPACVDVLDETSVSVLPPQDWIYRQLCETTTPLHTQLLPLIDAYVNSILTPASKTNPEATNQPITEQEILCVFQSPAPVVSWERWLSVIWFWYDPRPQISLSPQISTCLDSLSLDSSP